MQVSLRRDDVTDSIFREGGGRGLIGRLAVWDD